MISPLVRKATGRVTERLDGASKPRHAVAAGDDFVAGDEIERIGVGERRAAFMAPLVLNASRLHRLLTFKAGSALPSLSATRCRCAMARVRRQSTPLRSRCECFCR